MHRTLSHPLAYATLYTIVRSNTPESHPQSSHRDRSPQSHDIGPAMSWALMLNLGWGNRDPEPDLFSPIPPHGRPRKHKSQLLLPRGKESLVSGAI